MRFRVPVMFNAEVVHKGKRKAVAEALTEWLDIEIMELDGVEAPLATEWTDDSGIVMRTRWHDGCHWREHRVRDVDGDDQGILSAQELARMSSAGEKFGNPLAVGVEWVLKEFAEGTRSAYDPDDFRQVAESDRAEVMAKAERQAADTVVVDGTVWVRSSEPVYVLRRHRISRTEAGHRLFCPDVVPVASTQERDLDDVFRADRFDDMKEEARARFGEVEVASNLRISVHVPESIRHDDEKQALFAGIASLLESKRKFLATSPLHEIRPWLELAESLDEARRQWNGESAASLENAADTYMATALAADSWYAGQMDRILTRWRMRPIADDFDGAAVPDPKQGGTR